MKGVGKNDIGMFEKYFSFKAPKQQAGLEGGCPFVFSFLISGHERSEREKVLLYPRPHTRVLLHFCCCCCLVRR